METPTAVNSLEAAWHRLSQPFHCRVTRDAFFEGIAGRYLAPDRHYHTLRHVAEMLRIIDRFRGRLESYEAVAFAAWFHDVVYDPRADDNERRSAVLARRTLSRLAVPGSVAARAEELILATDGHAWDGTFDAGIFLDADLAILGARAERYAEYRDDIRKEYFWMPDGEFRSGRATVLERFLSRERIYVTPELHDELEGRARENVRGEVEALAGG